MYFDYTATTKMDEEILKLYINVQEKYYANTTSLHKFGQKCNYYYEKMQAEKKEKNKQAWYKAGIIGGCVLAAAFATQAIIAVATYKTNKLQKGNC